MRKLVGEIEEVNENKISFKIISNIPCDLKEETELEERDSLILEISKHIVILRKF